MPRIYELKQKEVINIRDGSRHGYVADVEINIKTGMVESIIVPGPARVLGVFGRDQEFQIPWSAVKRIGDDLIIIEAETDDVLADVDY